MLETNFFTLLYLYKVNERHIILCPRQTLFPATPSMPLGPGKPSIPGTPTGPSLPFIPGNPTGP